MAPLIVLGLVSLVMGLIATRVCRDFARARGIVDKPDRVRKLHREPVPRIGGVAVGVAYISAYLLLLLLPLPATAYLHNHFAAVQALVPAVVLIFATGLIDDLFTLNAWQKLGGEVLAAVWAYYAGVQVTIISGAVLPGWLNLPITVLWLVGCANALNLIDGLDGLAAGVGLFASATTLCSALLTGRTELALATVPLVGALLGFLRYNFSPASIFLGDSGSLLIGFLLGCYAVLWTQKSATLLGMTAPAIALTVPIVDTGLAVLRRFLLRRPIFSADRGHIHHRLLELGLSPRGAVLVLYACCALAATASLAGSSFQGAYGAATILAFCALVAVGIRLLRYAELRAVARVITSFPFRGQISAQVSLANLQSALSTANNDSECWTALRETCRHLGFDEVRLTLGGVEFADKVHEICNGGWSAQIPISDGADFVVVKRQFNGPEAAVTVSSLADVLRASFEAQGQRILARCERDVKRLPLATAPESGLPAA